MALSAFDTSTKRLLAMKAVLESALDGLQKAGTNPNYKYLDGPIADVKYALDGVAKGLDYVKAHPESDTLIQPSTRVAWPELTLKNGVGLGPKRSDPPASLVQSADDMLMKSEQPFLVGNSTANYSVMNDLGGYRDKILRGVDTADAVIVKWGLDNERRSNPRYTGETQPPSPASHSPTDQGGSISGKVLNPRGQPAAYAAISIHLFGELGGSPSSFTEANASVYGNKLRFPGGVLATVTDANGNYIIKDLVPGTYVVSANLATKTNKQSITHLPVEVKAGAETKIVEPMTMFSTGLGIGN